MERINRMMINICSEKLSESKYFYTQLFDFEVDFDSDWFVHMVCKDKSWELGIIEKANALVPAEYRKKPLGFYLTFVVDDVEVVYKKALSEKMEVLAEPVDTAYGQRRLILKDPNGAMVDVSSPIKDFEFQ